MTAEILNETALDSLMSIKDANCDPWLDYEPRLCGKGRAPSIRMVIRPPEFGGLFFVLRADGKPVSEAP
jgi:hypothetical protein